MPRLLFALCLLAASQSLSWAQVGCTDPSACNFNYTATSDDESCVYAIVAGDCEAGVIACGEGTHWNPLLQQCVVSGFQSCVGDLDSDGLVSTPDLLAFLAVYGTTCPPPGCTDSMALNYNPQAQVNDGSCLFPPCLNLPPGTNCDGSCTIDVDLDGICDGEDDCVASQPDCYASWMSELPSSFQASCEEYNSGGFEGLEGLLIPDITGCCPQDVVQVGGQNNWGSCTQFYECPSEPFCSGNAPMLELFGVDELGLSSGSFSLDNGGYLGVSELQPSVNLLNVSPIDLKSYGMLSHSVVQNYDIGVNLIFDIVGGGAEDLFLIPMVSYFTLPNGVRIVVSEVTGLGTTPYIDSNWDLGLDEVAACEFDWVALHNGELLHGTGSLRFPVAGSYVELCPDCWDLFGCVFDELITASFSPTTGHAFKLTSVQYADTDAPVIEMHALTQHIELDLNGQGANGVDLTGVEIPYQLYVTDDCVPEWSLYTNVSFGDTGPYYLGNAQYLVVRNYDVYASDGLNAAQLEIAQSIFITDIGN